MDSATRVSNPPRMYFFTLSGLRNRLNIVISPPAGARTYARVKPLDFQGRATFTSISQAHAGIARGRVRQNEPKKSMKTKEATIFEVTVQGAPSRLSASAE